MIIKNAEKFQNISIGQTSTGGKQLYFHYDNSCLLLFLVHRGNVFCTYCLISNRFNQKEKAEILFYELQIFVSIRVEEEELKWVCSETPHHLKGKNPESGKKPGNDFLQKDQQGLSH